MSKPRNKVDRLEEQKFIQIVSDSKSINEVAAKIGYLSRTKPSILIKRRVEKLELDISHFEENQREKPIEEQLVKNKKYTGTYLKKKLIQKGILEDLCTECGIGPIWDDEPIVLQLDHINGIHTDNRLENLRILCPNCHSQTTTYTGKNKSKKTKEKEAPINTCPECHIEICKTSKKCRKCTAKEHIDTNRPSLDQLLKDVKELGYCGTGRKYGVSDNAIRKWIRKHKERLN